jgi:hypothetical protein
LTGQINIIVVLSGFYFAVKVVRKDGAAEHDTLFPVYKMRYILFQNREKALDVSIKYKVPLQRNFMYEFFKIFYYGGF